MHVDFAKITLLPKDDFFISLLGRQTEKCLMGKV